MAKITVFTPTYNRKYIILNLYKSLQAQTYHNFEWLVIDDGSTDGTGELFEKILSENNVFTIRYYRFENSGKQKEINRALDLAEGKLFFTVDSDDLLTSDALEKINLWESQMPADGKYCGFAGSDGNLQGEPTNPIFEDEYVDATFFDRDPNSNNFIGYDRPWVLYTNVHRQYKYPEFEGEKFITEAVVWNRLAADGYKIRCYNDVIYLREHQDVGLTSRIHDILVENPRGYGLWIKEMAEQHNYSWICKLKTYYSFYCDMYGQASVAQIAEYVGARRTEINVISIIYKIKKIKHR